MTTLLHKAKNMLMTDETILFYTACSLDIFIYRSVARPGLLILTNKRLFFYGPDVSKNPLFEEYSLAKISNLKEQKRLFSNQIVFMYDNEWKKIKHIRTNDVSSLVQKINEQLSK
ncbi:PH domain-containing protein [Bacillus tropicus]|uniref:PH domain-containing protein n=1 Tax=Bacillus tropicus TaxID=2026188 RepID=UPI002406A821|nr:PH domain-containing protein [Bacillus tropicus]MDF9553966.1 PH domain-containing protein [Bacillus tropicus]MDF9587661.1 PH domain-containing protein [Bacillus tropicus]MDF9646636.1 PH domain-containing protein [Bacillus tropicus]HDR7797647.1 PH domain-containing protein [Bacillus tropicus]